MNELVDKRLVDEAVDAYVDWRDERACVWDAYARWTNAPCPTLCWPSLPIGPRWIERSAPRTCTPNS
jgi:hypothetical protein